MNKVGSANQVRALMATLVLIGMLGAAFAEGVTKRIRFPRGKTSTVVEGSVVRGERDKYILGARAGQKMTAHVSALENNAAIVIYKPGSKQTLDGAGEEDGATEWSGELPTGGNYIIIVGGTRGNASYRLAVTVE